MTSLLSKEAEMLVPVAGSSTALLCALWLLLGLSFFPVTALRVQYPSLGPFQIQRLAAHF